MEKEMEPEPCEQCGIVPWECLGEIEYCPECDKCLCPTCWDDPIHHKCIIPDESYEEDTWFHDPDMESRG
jgi:hypothetical protein